MIMDCVETLEVNDDGKISGMKAYWDMSRRTPSRRVTAPPRRVAIAAPTRPRTRRTRRPPRGPARARFSSGRDLGHNVLAMNVESRDSVSLKPAELDEVGQIFSSNGLPISDEELDRQVESFPLAVLASEEGDIHGPHAGLARAHRWHALDPVGDGRGPARARLLRRR